MPAPLPSLDQVLALPALVEGVVQPGWIDVNDHMNIRHHLESCAVSADRLCREIGIDDEYRAGRRLGVFTAEHHIRYLSELHLGEQWSVHPRVVDVSDKGAHLVVFLIDRTHDRISCLLEIVLLHVGMDTRRTEPFPPEIRAGWDRLKAAGDSGGWDAPTCGAMGLRRVPVG